MTRADPPRWRALSVPKHGHTEDEYEDAWAADPDAGRFAVADGASESAFAGLWARLLVEGFVAAPQPPALLLWLAVPRRRWLAAVPGRPLGCRCHTHRRPAWQAPLLRPLHARPPREPP